ncbi:MAG: hypothetical protein M9944_02640 [Rhizobiaceae bacterium]|nr:hypothetical protein [Rhizobiaceae bacterium]
MKFLQFHISSSGDRWLLARNESIAGFVRHEANSASDGSLSNIAISKFLDGNASSPECKALLRLIGSLVADEPADDGRFGAGANSHVEEIATSQGRASAVAGPR